MCLGSASLLIEGMLRSLVNEIEAGRLSPQEEFIAMSVAISVAG